MLRTALFLAAPLLIVHVFFSFWTPHYSLQDVEKDGFYGRGAPTRDPLHFSDFQIDVLDDEVENAKVLAQSVLRRMADGVEGANFESGFNVAYLRNLTASFLLFDWKQHQTFLNTFVHKMTQIEGVDVHFVKSEYPKVANEKRVPLLLLHDLYGSFWDFYKVLPFLGNPSRFGFDFANGKEMLAFDVIVPSLPGFLFSRQPQKKGFGPLECGRLLAKLMDRLGHERYVVHAQGRLGGEVASAVALFRPTAVRGLSLVNPAVDFSGSFLLQSAAAWRSAVGGDWETSGRIAREIVGARPQSAEIERPSTLGILLNSSPLALMAWMGDQWAARISTTFRDHPQGMLQSHSTVDEFLTEMFLYWLTGCSTSALQNAAVRQPTITRVPIPTIPVTIATFDRTARSISKAEALLKYPNLRKFERLRGGELVALENPKLLAELIFSFVEEELLKSNG